MMFPVKKSSPQLSVTVSAAKPTAPTNALKELQDKCYSVLMEDINGLAGALEVAPQSLINFTAIRVMSQRLPQTPQEMLKIPHITEANFSKYGKALLKITQEYALRKIALEEAEAAAAAAEEEIEDEENEFQEDWIAPGPSSPSSSTSSTSRSGNGVKRRGASNSGNNAKRYKSGGGNSSRGRGRGRGTRGAGTRGKSARGRGRSTANQGPGLVDFTQNPQFITDPLRFQTLGL